VCRARDRINHDVFAQLPNVKTRRVAAGYRRGVKGLPLKLRVKRAGPACVLLVSGELDIATAPSFAAQAAAALEVAPGQLVLDLSGLEFVDVGGARTLAAVAGAVPAGCPVLVRSASPRVRRVLGMIGMPGMAPQHHPVPPGPLDPVDRLHPVDPLDPVDRVDPVDRLDPVDPLHPVDPLEPVDLVSSIGPVGRSGPVGPLGGAAGSYMILAR
jgi:anti-anti-sigma factor